MGVRRCGRKRGQNGQSIVEYAYCIAFVGLLFAMALSVAKGTLFCAVSQSYSSINSALSNLNTGPKAQ